MSFSPTAVKRTATAAGLATILSSGLGAAAAPESASARTRCPTIDIPYGSFVATKLVARGMSCRTAQREVQRGRVGAKGYQRYGGWRCLGTTQVTCSKGSRSFSFKLA